MTLPDFLQSVADAIKEKTGKPEKIKPINFPSEIRSISGGGGGDLIDVETFPTTNVQDDKVYRTEVEETASYDLYMYDSASGTASSLGQEAISGGITLNYYEMNSTAEVENPLETNPDGSNVLNIYIEKPTGIAYIYYGGTWVTFGGLMSGDPTNTSFDKGYTTDPSTLTEGGVYVYKIGDGIYTGVGIPNANGDKLAFVWNGTKWVEQENVSRVVYDATYKAIERVVNSSSSAVRINWYAKFHRNYVEMISINETDRNKATNYVKISTNGDFYGIADDGEIKSIENVGTYNVNKNIITIQYDIVKLGRASSSSENPVLTSAFVVFGGGKYMKSHSLITVEDLENAPDDDIGTLFVYMFQIFRGGDFELQPYSTEWDSIVAQQGWDIP